MMGPDAIHLILKQLTIDENNRPVWPDSRGEAAIILAKKAGEVIESSIENQDALEDVDILRTKVAQAGALAMRFLMHLPNR
ncbi:MAG: hypothetical protein SWH54_00340 [Thermodesulfobacteriota bacterium]|nr:hypothetical protein [Thermodesulfobacteriota bacterium]